MKKAIFPKFSKITFIIAFVLLFANLLISGLEKLGVYIYFSVISTQEIIPSVKILCVVLLSCALAVFIFNNINNKVLCIILTVIISVLALAYCGLICFSELSFESKYYEYTSDYDDHRIVVSESSWLLAGGGTVYEKTSFCTMKEVGNYSTDDGFRPFSKGAYFFVWNEDNFELHHAFLGASDDKSMYKVVEMEYIK